MRYLYSYRRYLTYVSEFIPKVLYLLLHRESPKIVPVLAHYQHAELALIDTMASRLAVRCGRGSIAPLHAVRPTHWPVSRRVSHSLERRRT